MTDVVVPLTRPASFDFIESFMELTDGVPTPEHFRVWSGLVTIAGALERRVWVETARGQLYPNLYVLLVAPPGVGKSRVIEVTNDLWHHTKSLKIAPDSTTSASLLDSLTDARRVIVRDGTLVAEYHSLLVTADEFGVFCPEYDKEFLSRLNKIYDCPRVIRVRRKYLKDEVSILNPQLNILGGAQPGWLQSMLPEEAWSMGFTSRLIMIYSATGPSADLFNAQDERSDLRAAMLAHLDRLVKLQGKFFWTDDGAREIRRWHEAGGPPKPEHAKLAHYNTRRTLHVMKLALVSSAARGVSMRIEGHDVRRALAWLLAAEKSMPDIFRDMVGKSDSDTIRELHYFAWRLWVVSRKPLHESRLINFLRERMPHERINSLLEIAERANVLTRQAGTRLYVPNAEHEHGLSE